MGESTRHKCVNTTLLPGQVCCKRLEEDTRANSYIVKERLPKDIESKRKTVSDLQRVVAEPAMGQADLEELHKKGTRPRMKKQ
ncbi:hypothetical protein DPMN_133474 [Dreissena polymorpha]|uniref:Uncharacterized protein n=1 Tax=Dreissena polymorpha TaxID=45954 RepID=A0A9D4FUE3_DREPO|nr:hypothetical protein DPMN_133474 [Dreissena polymorpha]